MGLIYTRQRRDKIDKKFDLDITHIKPDIPEPIKEDSPGFFGTLKDIGAGIAGGGIDAFNSTIAIKDIFDDEPSNPIISNPFQTKTGWGEAANTITQIGLGLVGGGKVVKGITWAKHGFDGAKAALAATNATKGVKIAKSVAQGAIADFTVFDENESNLSDLLVKIPALQNPITEFLAGGEDDTKAERRFKNVLEGMALGGAAEIIFSSSKISKLFRKGKTAEAQAALEEAGEKLDSYSDNILDEAEAGLKKTDDLTFPETFSPSVKGEEAAKLFKPLTDEDTASYSIFIHSKADNRLKETIDGVSASIASDVEDILKSGETDIAAAFARALPSNKAYAEFGAGSDGRVYSLMAEAVRDKVVKKTTFIDIKAQADNLLDAGLMDDKTRKTIAEKATALQDIAPHLLLSRMETLASAQRFATAIGKRLRGDVAGTENIETLAKEFSTIAGNTQLMISGLGSGLGSLRIPPTIELLNKMVVNAKTKAAETVTAVKKGDKSKFTSVLEGKNLLDNLPPDKINVKDYLINEKQAKALDSLIKSGLDLNNAEHLRGLYGIVTDSDNKFTRLFADSNKAGYAGKTFRALYANSLLSSPATHVFNTLGNAIKIALSPATRIMGGILTQNTQAVKHGLYQYAAYASVFADSLKAAHSAFKAGGGIIDDMKEYPKIKAGRIADDFQMQWAKKAIDEGVNPIDAFNSVPDHIKTLSKTVGYVGSACQLPLRTMGATDELFKQMAYRSEVYAKAAVEAGEKGIADRATFVTARINASLDGGKALDKDALQYAREMTWTQEIKDEGIINHTAYNLKKIKPLQPFLPFITTPTNLFKDIIAHTPFAYALKDVRDAIAKGGHGKAIAEGKIALGQALTFTAFSLADGGKITGGYPKDPVAKQAWIDMGRLPYSFKIGDKYVPYNRLDPFGAFFGIAADLHDHSRRGGAGANEGALSLAAVVIKNLTSKTYAAGLVDAVDLLSNPMSGKGEYVIKNIATGLIPFSGALRFATRQLDPEMKEVQTMSDKLRAMIPGLSFDQPSRHSWITGKPHEVSYFVQDAKEDAVLEELINSSQGIRAGMPPKILQGVKLDAEQYSRLSQLQGTVEVGGRTLYESLSSLFDSAAYKNAEGGVDEDGESIKSKLTAKIIRRYRKAAIDTLKREDPSLVKSIATEQETKRQNAMKGANQNYDLGNL